MALASRKVRQYELDPEELERRLEASFTISAEELEREITELPDVSDKVAVVEPAEPSGDDGSGPAA